MTPKLQIQLYQLLSALSLAMDYNRITSGWRCSHCTLPENWECPWMNGCTCFAAR